MELFKTKSDFIDYIFSLQWQETENPFEIQCWPIGDFSLCDLIGYVKNLSSIECKALMSDIYFKAERIEFDKLSVLPQEIFLDYYEEKLQTYEIERALENNYPTANYVYQYLIKRLKTDGLNVPTDPAEGLKLPDKLNTERARRYFKRAVEAGLMTPTNNGYKWEKSNILLSLFIGILICGDEVKDSKWGIKWYLGTKEYPESAVEELFNIKNTGQQRLNNGDGKERWRNPPREHEIINEIFVD